MMEAMAGIIMADEPCTHFGVLTEKRSIAALPMAGRYRLIDFAMSNMVNSGIRNVGVATQYNYSSLMDHLGSGKAWDLNRKNSGLYMLPPFVEKDNLGQITGDIDTLYGIFGFIRKTKPDYFVITRASTFYNCTYKKALAFHKKMQSDITILYSEEESLDKAELQSYTFLETDETGRVTDIMKNHPHPTSKKVTMSTFIIERTLLMSLVEDCFARGEHDFTMDVLIKKLNTLRIFGYKFDGYVARVNSMNSYFKSNMDILNTTIRRELFLSKNKIFTKVKDQPPTRYGANANVTGSLIADGCIIDGTVENSIVFRGVKIGKGSTIKNSIVMQNSVILENCFAENVVLDKEVTLLNDKTVMGQPNYPFIIAKHSVV